MTLIDLVRSQIPHEVFEEKDLHLVLRDFSPAAQYSTLSRWLRSNKVVKIRRGLYAFHERYRKQPLSTYAIAAKLYSPSYISFESALSHHGLIPEAVYETTSACYQMKRKKYDTPFGNFSYHGVPEAAFRLGVESVAGKSGSFLLADPIKALFDLVYVRRKKYRSIREIESDLRIEPSELDSLVKGCSCQDLEELALAYKKRTTAQLCQTLVRELK